MFMTSAPRRLPAISKELCVRVEASKNRLISVRPRSDLRFGAPLRLSVGGLIGEVEQRIDLRSGQPLAGEVGAVAEVAPGSLVLLGSLKPCVYGQPRDAASPNLVFDAMGDMSTSRAIAVVALQRFAM